ncbi:MAG: hypothetical protein AAF957_07620 [Planctomycetota bacterium]
MTGNANGAETEGPRSPMAVLAEWRAEHGPQWSARIHASTGQLELLYGGNAAPPFQPDTARRSDWFELARHWVSATEAMHLTSASELVDDRFTYLPLGQGNSTDKITVRLEQRIGGVPVEGGAMNALFDTNGRLLSLHVKTAPEVTDPRSVPTIDAGFAGLVARESFRGAEGMVPNRYGEPELIYAWWDDGAARRWSLAWRVDVQYVAEEETPAGHFYTIDAHTGRILKVQDSVHFLDVTGTVSTLATPGTRPDTPANTPVQFVMPHVEVTSSAGTVVTDANGNFRFPGVNTPLDITVRYSGPFCNSTSVQGGTTGETFMSVQPNQANSLLMNPTPDEYTTAQANAFQQTNFLRDWIRERVPSDDTADFPAIANTNSPSSCNAFFTGSTTVYFHRAGGCNNTAYSTIVAHEMGHWLNVLYGTGNGSDGMGEGNADVFGLYVYDTPLIADEFWTNGQFLRTGENTAQFCGDSNPGCHGGVHANGRVWMGAAWKVRVELGLSLGDALGDMTADQLFLGWMNGFDQTQIRSIIEVQWLMLDDDDGNITNGTPNFVAIDSGFRQQGFPGYDLAGVDFANVVELGDVDDSDGPYSLSATITPAINTMVASAEIVYRVDDGPWVQTPLANTIGDSWSGGIPGQPNFSTVDYYLVGRDELGLFAEYPIGGAMNPITFRVGRTITFLENDFENAAFAAFTSGSSGDTATAGQWVLGDPIGTGAQPENDRTPSGTDCWFTGQGVPGGADDAADVDGGTTTLLTPVFQAQQTSEPRIGYWRWYSNGGGMPTDVLQVDISPDAGVTWFPVETVGPTGNQTQGGWFRHEFLISSIIAPTSTMQMRFVAADLGTPSIIEAAIDDFQGASFEFRENVPYPFCTANPTSSGARARMGWGGSVAVADNNLQISASNVGTTGLVVFIMGSESNQVPIGPSDGLLCVGGSIFRLGAAPPDPLFQTAWFALDLNSTPLTMVDPGETWHFQAWFRDMTAAGSNTTDGLLVPFK